MCGLADHIAWKASLGRELDGFLVAEVQHSHRGVMSGIANQRGDFAGAGEGLHQQLVGSGVDNWLLFLSPLHERFLKVFFETGDGDVDGYHQ